MRPKFFLLNFFILVVAACQAFFVDAIEQDFEHLVHEFNEISPPKSAIRVGGTRASKVGLKMFSYSYHVQLNGKQLRDYYEDELSAKGWKKKNAVSNPSSFSIIYCKGFYDSIIEVPYNEKVTFYTFTVKWEKFTGATTGC